MASGTIQPKRVKLLWENPNPNADFTPQTITLPNNDCDIFYVKFAQSKGDLTVFPGFSFFKPGEATAFMNPNGSSNGYIGNINLLIRRITASTQTTITFAEGYTIGASPSTNRNELAIPLAVYGFYIS